MICISQDTRMKQKVRSTSRIIQTNPSALNLLQAEIVIIDPMPYQRDWVERRVRSVVSEWAPWSERLFFFFSLKYYLKWKLAAMGRTRWRNELSSSSSSENSPRHEAKQNPAGADVAAMGCSADKQDDTNPFLLDVWDALKRIEKNTNSLIKDIKDLQNNHSNFLRPR